MHNLIDIRMISKLIIEDIKEDKIKKTWSDIYDKA